MAVNPNMAATGAANPWSGMFNASSLFSPAGMGTQMALGFVNSQLNAGARRRAARLRRQALEAQKGAHARYMLGIDTKNAMNQQAFDRTILALENRAQGAVVKALQNWEQRRDATIGRSTGDTGVQDTADAVAKAGVATGAADWLDSNRAALEQARVQNYAIPDTNQALYGNMMALDAATDMDRRADQNTVGFSRLSAAIGNYTPTAPVGDSMNQGDSPDRWIEYYDPNNQQFNNQYTQPWSNAPRNSSAVRPMEAYP